MNDRDLSFLPEDYLERRIQRRTNIICLTLFGVVLAGVAGAYVVSNQQRAEVLARQAEINAAFTKAAERITQLDELQRQKKALLRKARVTAALIEPVPRSNLLAELVNRMPDGVVLRELELKSTKLADAKPVTLAKGSAMSEKQKQEGEEPDPASQIPDPPRYDVELELIGVAPTDIQVAQYMTSLARCPLLSEVDLAYSEERVVEEMSMRRFRIDMKLDPDADVRLIEPLMAEREGGRFATVDPTPGMEE